MKKKIKLACEETNKDGVKKNKDVTDSNLKKLHSDVKALFSQRLLAFLIDVLIIIFVTNLITAFIPLNDTASKLYEEQNKILEDYVNGVSSMEVYVNQMIDIEYDISKHTVILSILSIIISLLYYVVYPCYNDGQTLGKKIMKIRIKKVNNNDLSMNDLLIRAMINNSIFLNILCIILILFLSKNMYLNITSIFSSIQYLVMIVSIIMIAFSKKAQGLHDKVAKTEVVMTNTVKEDVLCQIES